MYWAQALATQTTSLRLKESFEQLSQTLAENESTILDELNAAQGTSVDIGGYYLADKTKVRAAMRPSPTFNAAIDALKS